jgi:cytochrome c-type biogenesis protein CcmE
MGEVDIQQGKNGNQIKFIIGGVLIVAAVIYLIISSTQASAQYFLTIDEVMVRGNNVKDLDLRISGAVIGDSIKYDPESLTISFEVAHIPGDNDEINAKGGLAAVLNSAVNNPTSKRLQVIYIGPKPDLLQNEAQAILTGRLGEDGIFYADELLLKCPTKYESSVPDQIEG